MRKTWMVARHEFAVTAGRLSFRIFTAAVPVLVLVALVGFTIARAVIGDDEPSAGQVEAGYVDLTADAGGQGLFGAFREQGNTVFVPYEDQETAVEGLLAGRIDALYVFPPEFAENGVVVKVEEQQAGIGDFDGGGSSRALRNFILSNLYAEQVGDGEVERLLNPYALSVVEIDESGAPAEETDRRKLLFFLAAGGLLIISVFMTAGYLMQGLSEEKENRIMEVLLSSIKPEQLMQGKLLGLGAAGLMQMAVWTIAVLGGLFALGSFIDVPIDLLVPSPGGVAAALAYFLLGYAFFGTLQAAFGAITTNQREANSITVFVVLPAFVPMWFLQAIISDPEGTLARTLSFVPFTAPLTSLIRLGLDGMGALDLLLSLAALAVSVWVVVLLTTRLFKAYLLTFGQRPRIGDLFRTLRGG